MTGVTQGRRRQEKGKIMFRDEAGEIMFRDEAGEEMKLCADQAGGRLVRAALALA